MSELFVFSGAIGTGKSLAAEYLSIQYDFNRISFAEKLKEMAKAVTFDGRIDKKRDRKLLQFLGTDYYRSIDEDYWLRPVVERIEYIFSHGGNVVIDDARFENEFKGLQQFNATFVHILSSESDISDRLLDRDGTTNTGIIEHVSENAIGRIFADELVYNDKTKAEFVKELDIVYNLHRKKYHG